MKLICANFKMNLLKNDVINYINVIENKINKENIIFFPNNLYLNYFKEKNYLIGSQDISFQEFGAITGDTSPIQLKEFGINYTLIGHSERRKYFNDDNFINKKINIALKNNIKVILCIGETLNDFVNTLTLTKLKEQIDIAFLNNIEFINDNLIIAYEPIWSIGTNKIPTNDILKTTIEFIKKYIKTKYNLNIKILYGGSVNLNNILELNKINIIDGYLIGGASLDPNELINIFKIINK